MSSKPKPDWELHIKGYDHADTEVEVVGKFYPHFLNRVILAIRKELNRVQFQHRIEINKEAREAKAKELAAEKLKEKENGQGSTGTADSGAGKATEGKSETTAEIHGRPGDPGKSGSGGAEKSAGEVRGTSSGNGGDKTTGPGKEK